MKEDTKDSGDKERDKEQGEDQNETKIIYNEKHVSALLSFSVLCCQCIMFNVLIRIRSFKYIVQFNGHLINMYYKITITLEKST